METEDKERNRNGKTERKKTDMLRHKTTEGEVLVMLFLCRHPNETQVCFMVALFRYQPTLMDTQTFIKTHRTRCKVQKQSEFASAPLYIMLYITITIKV